MDIRNNIETLKIKQTLSETFNVRVSEFEHLLSLQENKIQRWEFATDEYYSVIPYYHELNKLTKGRLLKKVALNDRFNKANCFSFGFTANDRMILTQKSNGKGFGIESTVYLENEDGSTNFFCLRTYPYGEHPSKVISKGVLTNIINETRIMVTMSNDERDWSVSLYQYKNGNVMKVFRYSEGWNGQTIYDFLYKGNALVMIKVGNTIWWKAQ